MAALLLLVGGAYFVRGTKLPAFRGGAPVFAWHGQLTEVPFDLIIYAARGTESDSSNRPNKRGGWEGREL